MTISSSLNAILSDDVYKHRTERPGADSKRGEISLGGVQFYVLNQVDNKRTGYQGAIYQRVDTGEVIVAHRGTESVKDVLADAAMVRARVNPQAADAIKLTEEALRIAQSQGREGGAVPAVTVTGHSLGGTLAQIAAHHFNLKGETFNAYGAASLGLRMPSGGTSVINHVMANDPISAASPHYGSVVVYATQREISKLKAMGFSNGIERFFMDDSPITLGGTSLGSHTLGNFLGDRSVLMSSAARALAERNQTMIAEYRDDISERRLLTTIAARGPGGWVEDVWNSVRGPLQGGEPAKIAQDRLDRIVLPPLPQRDVLDQRVLPPLPPQPAPVPRPLQMSDPDHALHGMFLEARMGVHAQDAEVGRTPDAASDRLAGALTAAMDAAGGTRIDHVVSSADGSRMFAIQGGMTDPAHLRASVDTLQGLNTSLAQSSERVAEQVAVAAREPTLSQQHEHARNGPSVR